MPKTRLLVVDDARLVRTFVRKAFHHMEGVTIEEAEDGTQAQTLLSENLYDVILCDWDMPQMSGHDLLRWIRNHEDEGLRKLPFIMVTSNGEKEKVIQAVKSGVSGYVVKPFSSAQLVNKVQDVLSTRLVMERPGGQGETADGGASMAQIRFKGGTMEVEVRNLNAKGLTGRFRAGDPMPGLLTGVAADLKLDGSDQAIAFPAYVYRIEAAENSPKASHLNIGLRFLDMEQSKKDRLVNFLAGQRG